MRTTDPAKLQQVDVDIRSFLDSLKYQPVDTTTLFHTGMDIDVRCNVCNTLLQNQRISKFQYIYKHYGTRACPACKVLLQDNSRIQRIQLFIIELEKTTPLRLVNHAIPPQSNTDKHLYLSTTCGHTFLSTIDNIKANNPIVCSACSRIQANEKIRATSKIKSAANKTLAPTLIGYTREVRSITESNYREHKQLINPNNYPRSHAKHKTGYQLDHIIPVRLGYELRLSPELIGNVNNLQMLDWETNIKVQEFLDRKLTLVENTAEHLTRLCTQYSHLVFDGANITTTQEYLDSEYYLNFPFFEFVPSNKNKRLTQQQFVDRITIKSPSIKVIGQYVNSYTKIEMECNCGHTWSSKPNDLQKGHSCPVCARTKKDTNNA